MIEVEEILWLWSVGISYDHDQNIETFNWNLIAEIMFSNNGIKFLASVKDKKAEKSINIIN